MPGNGGVGLCRVFCYHRYTRVRAHERMFRETLHNPTPMPEVGGNPPFCESAELACFAGVSPFGPKGGVFRSLDAPNASPIAPDRRALVIFNRRLRNNTP